MLVLVSQTNGKNQMQGMQQEDFCKRFQRKIQSILLNNLCLQVQYTKKTLQKCIYTWLSCCLDKRSICIRTQNNYGKTSWKKINQNGSGSSCKWNKRRQSDKESHTTNKTTTQLTSKTSTKTNPMSSLQQMDETKSKYKKCRIYDSNLKIILTFFETARRLISNAK